MFGAGTYIHPPVNMLSKSFLGFLVVAALLLSLVLWPCLCVHVCFVHLPRPLRLCTGSTTIKAPSARSHVHFPIPDSREGWVESVRLVLEAYFSGKPVPTFDYSQIRPAGSQIMVRFRVYCVCRWCTRAWVCVCVCVAGVRACARVCVLLVYGVCVPLCESLRYGVCACLCL